MNERQLWGRALNKLSNKDAVWRGRFKRFYSKTYEARSGWIRHVKRKAGKIPWCTELVTKVVSMKLTGEHE